MPKGNGWWHATIWHAGSRRYSRTRESHRAAVRRSSQCTTTGLGLEALGLDVEPCYTNMVYFHHPKAPALIELIHTKGVLALALTPTRIRMVTHLQVSRRDIQRTVQSIQDALNEFKA